MPNIVLKMKTKAQIKMTENVLILFMFFILLGLGLIFYSNVQKESIKKVQEQNFELKTIETAQRVSFLPELQCSTDNIMADNCFDIFKVRALSDVLLEPDNRQLYFQSFGNSKITLKQIYPEGDEYVIYEKTPPNITDNVSIQLPVSILDASSQPQTYSFGIIEVRVFR